MSKSLGNFFTVADLREKNIPGEVMRLAMLMTHYRSPIDWTEKAVGEAEKALRKWRGVVGDTPAGDVPQSVLDALGDELNTPLAVAELHKLAANGDAAGLRAGAEVMGLLTDALGGWDAELEADAHLSAKIDGLLADRAAAKAAKDFGKADGIRAALVEAGVEVKDVPGGAEWSLTPSFDASKLPDVENV